MKQATPFTLVAKLDHALVKAALAQVATIPSGLWQVSKEADLNTGREFACLVSPPVWVVPPTLEMAKGFTKSGIYTGPLAEIVSIVQGAVGGGKVGHAYVSRTRPYNTAYPHIDFGEYYQNYHRVQVCLQTSSTTIFTCDTEAKVFKPRECWLFDNQRQHSVVNGAGQIRYALVVDIARADLKDLG